MARSFTWSVASTSERLLNASVPIESQVCDSARLGSRSGNDGWTALFARWLLPCFQAMRMIATWAEELLPKLALMRQTSNIVSATRSSMISAAGVGTRSMKKLASREKYIECRRRSAKRLPVETAASNRRSVMSARGSDARRSASSALPAVGVSANDPWVVLAASQQTVASARVACAVWGDGMELSHTRREWQSMAGPLGEV